MNIFIENHMSSKASKTSQSSQTSAEKRLTPGYKSVLVHESVFNQLKQIQMACSNPRLDLRHVATGAIAVALAVDESVAVIPRTSVKVLIEDAQQTLIGVKNDVSQKND